MNKNDAEEYTQSLGQIVAGSWRQIALAQRLGVPKALDMKLDEWVRERLGGYIKMAISERKEAIAELSADGYSNREIAAVVGIDEITVRRDKGATNVAPLEENNNTINEDHESSATNVAPLDAIPAAQKTRSENEKNRKAALELPAEIRLQPGLYNGDFRELSKQIADESVQLVFTDPPYDADSVGLYGDAARVAARILRPGGSFIAYSGQRHLPGVLSACATYLDYWWTIAGVHTGGNQILNRLGVRCGWKPLVWFVKGTRGDVQNVLSDVVSGSREKDSHEWQQSEQEARYYIEKLTPPGGLVVDFFVGGGTTAAAAKGLNRQWIGFEIDAGSAERASKRIEAVA